MISSVKIIIGFFNGILKQKIKIILNQRKQLVSCLKITLDFKGQKYQLKNECKENSYFSYTVWVLNTIINNTGKKFWESLTPV